MFDSDLPDFLDVKGKDFLLQVNLFLNFYVNLLNINNLINVEIIETLRNLRNIHIIRRFSRHLQN